MPDLSFKLDQNGPSLQLGLHTRISGIDGTEVQQILSHIVDQLCYKNTAQDMAVEVLDFSPLNSQLLHPGVTFYSHHPAPELQLKIVIRSPDRPTLLIINGVRSLTAKAFDCLAAHPEVANRYLLLADWHAADDVTKVISPNADLSISTRNNVEDSMLLLGTPIASIAPNPCGYCWATRNRYDPWETTTCHYYLEVT